MRAFIAIGCPDSLGRELAIVQEEIKDLGDMKLVAPGSIHLTVKFLGEVDEKKAGDVIAALEGVRSPAFDVSLKGIGAFPSIKSPRVVWAGVDAGRSEMQQLHKSVDDILLPLGFERDERFSSHFTLARFKCLRDKDKFKEMCEKYSGRKFGCFRAEGMDLMQSVLKRDGPVYSAVRRFVF